MFKECTGWYGLQSLDKKDVLRNNIKQFLFKKNVYDKYNK